MELRHLRYFAAVAEQLHFRHAAELVHVAQPALSQQIRQLEEEIGVKLFERSRHNVRLTPAGKAFYENTQRILRQVDQAVSKAKKVELLATADEVGIWITMSERGFAWQVRR